MPLSEEEGVALANASQEAQDAVRRIMEEQDRKWAVLEHDRSGRVYVPDEYVGGIVMGANDEVLGQAIMERLQRGQLRHREFVRLQGLLTDDTMARDSYSLEDVLSFLEGRREEGLSCGLCRPVLDDLGERKDGAYCERNQVVALVARMALNMGLKAGITKTDIPGWNDEWHNCVYIELPSGQVSWHYHDSHAKFFEGLPEYEGEWDGHSTPEKYERVLDAFNELLTTMQEESG